MRLEDWGLLTSLLARSLTGGSLMAVAVPAEYGEERRRAVHSSEVPGSRFTYEASPLLPARQVSPGPISFRWMGSR
jgi:hypothetical protein